MKKTSFEKWKKEVFNTEQDFAKMAKKEGIAKAFLFYAADEAVLNRNNTLIAGKEKIGEYLEKTIPKNGDGELSWTPDFVDVSSSGDMAYTYGSYVFTMINTAGDTVENKGVFHTVWKRQADGSWRFVWD